MNWRRTSGTFSILGLAAVGGILHAGCHSPAPTPESEKPVTAPEEPTEATDTDPEKPKAP